jgi:hypothetical protein
VGPTDKLSYVLMQKMAAKWVGSACPAQDYMGNMMAIRKQLSKAV